MTTTHGPPEPSTVRRLAVFLPNWVGDAVMATPALRALRTRYADATVVAVCRPPVGDVLVGTDLADGIVALPKSQRAAWASTRTLRSERADFAVLFPNSLRTAAVARLAGARRILGFDRDSRRWLLTDPVPTPDRSKPSSTLLSYNKLAVAAGCDDPGTETELAVLPADEAAFEAVLEERPVLRDGFVALNPGGAFGAAKHWPTAHFADLAGRIAATLDRSVLALCGPGERAIAQEIAALADDPRVVSIGVSEDGDRKLSIGLTKAAVRAADLLVTTDSGPRHFAGPLGTPAITLFGPTHIAWSETFHENATHLQIPVDCGPCQQRTCPLGHLKCMTDLSPDRVYAAVRKSLAASPSQRIAA
ncbi:lipopolysaccharide heptosyltransferase II [Alienimonas chondri]|uniref:lipopolysaccharide heptosyltransferase II n=1 Tax=Alienimonas chondri TaxID=2681879 RepID=A0ABX1VF48_9PLAN|nr:lipopolysaccharide heptosyltransferase II [Alienimonas chondri]NNJ26710.1 ADP-heptose--LPS heptosyltransferase 2 [Alienimonas chondri]